MATRDDIDRCIAEDRDYERRQAIAEDREERKRHRGCVCGDDLPGTCPGIHDCPYSGAQDEDEDETETRDART